MSSRAPYRKAVIASARTWQVSRLVGLLLAALTAVVVWAGQTGPAQAAPAPAPTTTAPVTPPATAVPTAAPTSAATDTTAVQEGNGAGVGGQLFGPDGVDLSHYDIGWDDGSWDNFYRHFWGNLTDMAWTIHRWIVSVGVWFLTWTFQFGFAGMLLTPVSNVFNIWQHHVVEPLGLPKFCFFLTCVWFGWLMLRRRAAAAVGD